MKLIPLYLIFSIIFFNPIVFKYSKTHTDSCNYKCKISQKPECARCLNFLIFNEEIHGFLRILNSENPMDILVSKLEDGIKKELLKPPNLI